MIDFSFTEEQKLIRDAVRAWCKKNLTLEKIREVDTKEEFPVEYMKGLSELGVIGMTFPEEHGGVGSDWTTTVMVTEELAYHDITIVCPVTLMVLCTGWGFIIDKYCSEEVRDKYVKKCLRGEGLLGIATTESQGGSDISNIKTTAKKEGDKWVINGEKTFISGTEEMQKFGGGYWLLTGSKPELGHRGMTAFFLPLDTPGVKVTKRFEDMGRMGISTGGWFMDNVKLPDSYRLGDENAGFYLTMEGFDAARLILSATCVGAARRALDIGMDYMKNRVLFGRPIGKFEGIQFHLADLYTELEATRALIYKTAWLQDKRYKEETSMTTREARARAREVSKWISMCKLKAPFLAFDIFKSVMVWHGAMGYTKECPLEMGLRAIFSYCVGAEGAHAIQQLIIGRELLGKEFVPYR